MKANELRIGNWVKCIMDGGITIETDVTHLPNGVWSPYDIGTHITDDTFISEDFEVDPIPLTEEWLLKFGFIRQGGRKMWVKDKLCIDLKELPNIRGEFLEGWYIGLKDLGNVLFHSFMKVNHVHQLQNLYFALTGEELTIKKIDNK